MSIFGIFNLIYFYFDLNHNRWHENHNCYESRSVKCKVKYTNYSLRTIGGEQRTHICCLKRYALTYNYSLEGVGPLINNGTMFFLMWALEHKSTTRHEDVLNISILIWQSDVERRTVEGSEFKWSMRAVPRSSLIAGRKYKLLSWWTQLLPWLHLSGARWVNYNAFVACPGRVCDALCI